MGLQEFEALDTDENLMIYFLLLTGHSLRTLMLVLKI